jgi:hypothetical protein
VKYKGTISEVMSGKLAGIVASRNKGGTYFRRLRVPSSGTPTAPQQALRNAVRAAAPAWQALTDVQRSGWNTYAQNVLTVDAIGAAIQLSGFNWFTGSNSLRSQSTLPLVQAAPTIFDRGGVDLSGSTWAAGATAGTLTLTGTAASLLGGSTADHFIVFQGRDFSPGRAKYFGSYQVVDVINGNDTHTSFIFATAFPHAGSNSQEIRIVTVRGDGRYDSGQTFQV